MSAHMPIGSDYQKAAAWELIVASIILFVMILVRFAMKRGSTSKIVTFFNPIMKEDGYGHLILYFVLFALVFSSAMSFFT